MLWYKALHVIAMVSWFAGLFYLPRLFVYHATASDEISHERFKVMERRLYRYIMTPAAVLTLLFGFIVFSYSAREYALAAWMQVKLTMVLCLIVFHCYCGYTVQQFAADANKKSERFFRLINEVPTVLLIVITLMVIVQPF